MPRFGVNALRWLLVVVNLGVLIGLGFLGWELFVPAESEQLRVELPDPKSVDVPEIVQKTFDRKDLDKALQIHKAVPPRKAEPVEKTTELPPVTEGGPLSGWQVDIVITGDDRNYATITEKVQTNIIPSAGRALPARPAARAPASRTPASRARSPRAAQPNRRVQAAPTNSRWVGVGEKFTIEGNDYFALRITPTPEAYELEYKAASNNASFVITGTRPEVLGYEKPAAGGILLLGLTAEELGIEPGQGSEVAGGAPGAEDQKGEVRPVNPDPRAAKQPDARERDAAARKGVEADKQKAQAEIDRLKLGEQEREALKSSLQEGGGKPQ